MTDAIKARHAPATLAASFEDEEPRPLGPALRNGWRLKCPSCGQGPLMRAYLKTHDHCPVCDEPFHHHRADDGPAYSTILIGGHVMAPFLMATYTLFEPNPLVVAIGFSTAFTGLSLWLLPRMKGIFVAFQWARRMHGFGAPIGNDAPTEASEPVLEASTQETGPSR